MKLNNIKVFGMYSAIKNIRQSYNSQSDSRQVDKYNNIITDMRADEIECFDHCGIGNNDYGLIQGLIVSRGSERKFLRQIFVGMEITAPRYWWCEMDTYKIGTVANSQSTMHTIIKRNLTKDDFEVGYISDEQLKDLNNLIKLYRLTKDIEVFLNIKRTLPEGFLQTRYWTSNYEVLRSIYFDRKNHKLQIWRKFCESIMFFPESYLITTGVGK